MPNMMKAIASGIPTIMKNPILLIKTMPTCISTSCQFLLISLKPSLIASIYFIYLLNNNLFINIFRQFPDKP